MYRPMIKWEHWPVRHGEGVVRIGGIIPGVGKDIPDPDGWVWMLLGLLDGTRTMDQIVAEAAGRFPHKCAMDVRTEVQADLAALVDAGHVEDAAALPPEDLTATERERYSRGRPLWRWMDRTSRRSSWEVQMRLRQARVVVIGVGGVGGTVALTLALSGVGELHLVEPDVVELSNLNRQVLYTEQDVGRPKVDVAVELLRRHNTSITVTGEALTVTEPSALVMLAARFDVVVLAADKPPEIWSWTNQACVRSGTAWTHGGYDGPQVNIGLFRPGTGPCYDCAYTAERERRATLPARTPMPGGGVWAPHAANAVTAGIAGQLTAHAAMSLITGVPGLPVNREYGINLITLEDSVVCALDAPRPDCPTCGTIVRPA